MTTRLFALAVDILLEASPASTRGHHPGPGAAPPKFAGQTITFENVSLGGIVSPGPARFAAHDGDVDAVRVCQERSWRSKNS